MDRAAIIGAIRTCNTREKLDDIFTKFNVSSQKEKIEILVEAMYSPDFFFSNEDPTIDQRYELTIEMFLDGEWRFVPAINNAMEKNCVEI